MCFIECRTVACVLPPMFSPICVLEQSVSLLARYAAVCLIWFIGWRRDCEQSSVSDIP